MRPDQLQRELEKLVRIAERRQVHVAGTIERALQSFKLGFEVAFDPNDTASKELGRRREEFFQRLVIKFLVERDIPAFGTKFGRSEVDIHASDVVGPLVIETKIITGNVSESGFNRWLTQLGSYMDQANPSILRGSLVIFNFGDLPIFVSVKSMRVRYLITVLNLCTPTASKRTGHIEVRESAEPGRLVDVLRVGAREPPASTKRTAKKKKRVSKKTQQRPRSRRR